jgi:hypothetical protein
MPQLFDSIEAPVASRPLSKKPAMRTIYNRKLVEENHWRLLAEQNLQEKKMVIICE